MQTRIPEHIRETVAGAEAESILRNCVHCGFCNATCPTYQLLGDELDGPRGRIYQIKDVLEGGEVTRRTQQHLDRCLTCRNCETTCPSGVEYGRLVDIGREWVEARVARPWHERAARRALRTLIPEPRRFRALLGLGRLARPVLPAGLRRRIPARQPAGTWPAPRHARRLLCLTGCAQPAMAPRTDAAAARVLDAVGVSLIAAPAGCCGAVDQHMAAPEAARARMRANIDAWWPELEAGAEGILVTASGCGAQVRDYGRLLADDPDYAERAARVSEAVRDPVEVVTAEELAALRPDPAPRVAVQEPCTLQHGQQLGGRLTALLQGAGLETVPVAEGHLCCGSAGTYSLLQPALAGQLRERKLGHLTAGEPAVIATANIGCQHHLEAASPVPVRHWLELFDPEGMV